jgi:peptidoglycan/LPS O-acetylase OafA/YrhL/SAM-dependent methyltransferase
VTGRRLTNLDVLRALAALAVLAGHAYALGGRAAPIKAQFAYDVPLITLASGVWLFFAISGYVIGRPFIERLLRGEPPPSLTAYALRRAARIFPLYWLALSAEIVIAGGQGTRGWQYPIHYVLLNNLVPGRQAALFSVAWTLTLEALFYVLVPLLALAVAARGRRPSAESLARMVITSWALSIAFTVFADLQGDGLLGLWLRGSLPAMWQMFCPGLLIAIAPHLDGSRLRRVLTGLPGRRRSWPAVVIALTVPAALLGAAAPLRFGIPVYQLLVDASRPLFAIAYGLIVAVAIGSPRWRTPWLLRLGLASYGIYLLHPLIEALLVKLAAVPVAGDGAGAFAVNAAVLAGLTIPLALASWRWLERPAIAMASSRMPAVGPQEMRSFWNDRAREDAFYFVDTRRPYKATDAGRFWDAEALVDYLLDGLGVALRPQDAVVEIGCGLGRITRVLAARSADVLALDVSDEMLARAREHNPHLANVRWILGDGRSLAAVADGSADACISVVVLQHVPDPEITLGYVREVGRVLRPGGWAALQVSDDPAIHAPRPGRGRRLRAALGRAPRGQRHPAWLGSAVDLAALREAADAAAMDVERVWGRGSQYCQVLLRRRAAPGC